MEEVAFGLTLLASLDLCLKYGEKISKAYKTYKNANEELGEAILRVQNHWYSMERELVFLRTIMNVLEEEVQIHLATCFHRLHIRLQDVTTIIDGLIEDEKEPGRTRRFLQLISKKGKVKKLKFAVRTRGTLEQALLGLEEWHRMFQPFFFLLVLVKNPAVDSQLAAYNDNGNPGVSTIRQLRSTLNSDTANGQEMKSIFLPESALGENRTRIMYTMGELTQETETGESVYVETFIPDPWTSLEIVSKNVRDLGRKLSVVDPSLFGIPVCSGIVKVHDAKGSICAFQMAFRIPKGLDRSPPRSLREVLLTKERYPLKDCLDLARQLSRSVMFVHTACFVHKNIRPETILILAKEDSPGNVSLPFLVGFEQFRPEDGATYLKGDSAWEKDLYRHPTRQGLSPEDNYRMQHDIYSLGVILLEIGLWGSFVVQDDDGKGFHPGGVLNISPLLAMKRQSEKARGIKEELLKMARTRLPTFMGPRYTQVVVMCLCCLDRDESNEFGHESEFLDEDGLLVGVRYIEKILMKLEEIVV